MWREGGPKIELRPTIPVQACGNWFSSRLSDSEENGPCQIMTRLISSTAASLSNDRKQRHRPELVRRFTDVNRRDIFQVLSPRHMNISPRANVEMLTYISLRCVLCDRLPQEAPKVMDSHKLVSAWAKPRKWVRCPVSMILSSCINVSSP